MIRNDKLIIFEDFQEDRTLPKFRKERSQDRAKFSVEDSSDDEEGFGEIMMSSTPRFVSNGGVAGRPQTFADKMAEFFFVTINPFLLLHDKREEAQRISIGEFFRDVKNSTSELEIVNERLEGYRKALQNAKKNGQTALFERLTHGIEAVRAETQLVALGMPKYLSEDTLVAFVKKAQKGLRLDHVRNFIRMIPEEVAQRRHRCDELGIFDNYVVLHFDPGAKSWAETEEEKLRRKDPILFGLLRGRRNLYFIGDWVDEFCDLTLDQIADTMGKECVLEIPTEVQISKEGHV